LIKSVVHVTISDREIVSADGGEKTWEEMVKIVGQTESTLVGSLFLISCREEVFIQSDERESLLERSQFI